MSYKLLVKCPKCEQNGVKSVLGELRPTGHFVIQRFLQYNEGTFSKKYTIIGGEDFYVICDKCGENVYFKRSIGVHWSAFGQTPTGFGTPSVSSSAGTN